MWHLKYSYSAIIDLNNCYDYLCQRNKYAAKSLIDRIEDTILKITDNPYIGHSGRVENTLEMVVLQTSYFLVYTIIEDTIKIVAIIHNARRFP